MARKARAPSGASGADGVWRTISQLPQRAKTAIGTASTRISRRAKLIGSALPQLAAGLRQGGQDLLEVADDPEVRLLENRRLGIGVDGDDRSRVAAAGHVLHGARDADRAVQLRAGDLARQSYLHVAGHPAGVDRHAAGADDGAELVGQLFEELEVLGPAQAAPARHDDLGVFQALRLRPLAYSLHDAAARRRAPEVH